MKKGVRLIDWIICDDMRREDNGKRMFIGVYEDGNIALPSVPCNMPQLVVYSKWDISTETFIKYEFKMTRPNGDIIGPVIADIPADAIVNKNKVALKVVISPFSILVCGEYKIEFTINDIVQEFESIKISLIVPSGTQQH